MDHIRRLLQHLAPQSRPGKFTTWTPGVVRNGQDFSLTDFTNLDSDLHDDFDNC